MANVRRITQINLAHWPTIFLIVGYPLYWLQLYLFHTPDGQTGMMAWLIAGILGCGGILALKAKDLWKEVQGWFRSQTISMRCMSVTTVVLIIFILGITAVASLLPPHLLQEYDTINYHYTLPRQHLILASFAHIPWAADDLFLLPIQFALAPFWFASSLPNKLPQLFFFIGLLAVLWGMTRRLGGGFWSGVIVVAAVVGSHGLGIQMGTAMLDLAIAYLFFGALDSFLRRDMLFFVVESVFFVWSKSMVPLQMALILFMMAILFIIAHRHIKFFSNDAAHFLKRSLGWFAVGSLVVGGPFVVKSFYYAGTPLYPFMPGLFPSNQQMLANPVAWQSLLHAAAIWTDQIKDGYGYGRSIGDFIKHFWLIAVPIGGVNNRFDYPLGLPLLLFVGPFLTLLYQRWRRHQAIPVLFLFIVASWGCWWFGSQQARFLYIPMIAMFVVVALEYKKSSRILLGALIVALSLNVFSVYRAHAADLSKSGVEVLRSKDREIMDLNKKYIARGQHGYVLLEDHDAAYAQFPVMVRKEKLPHTVAF